MVQVEFSINNTVHCTTKQTRSILLFGVEQQGDIVDELTEYLDEVYVDDFRKLNEIRGEAQQAIESSQLYNQKYFAEHHKPAEQFIEGDLVVN